MADLREILSAMASGLGQALSGLVGETIDVSLADLKAGSAAEYAAGAAEGGVSLPITASGGLEGGVVLWLPDSSAKVLAGALAGEEAAPEELSDLHVSALGEMSKLAAEALQKAVSTAIPGAQLVSGDATKVEAGGLAQAIASLGEEVSQGSLTLTVKGAGVDVQLYIAGSVAAAVSTATAEVSPQKDAAAADGFKPGVGEGTGQGDQPAEVQNVELGAVKEGQVLDIKAGLELLGDVNVHITVELGRTSKYVREVLNFSSGSIIELDKMEGEPVDVFVNDMLFARGEVVTIDENFAVRITDIMSEEERYGNIQRAAK